MAIDIRATSRLLIQIAGSTVSGMPAEGYQVISGSISDEPLSPEGGLVSTSGAVVVKGRAAIPADADAILQFQYKYKGKLIARRIPRKLKTIAYTYNPFTDTTSVDVACRIKQNYDKYPLKKVSPYDDLENEDLPDSLDTLELTRFPIRAVVVAITCGRGMRFPAGFAPDGLRNEFLKSALDLSPGYGAIMADLLRSEGYAGYAGDNLVIHFSPIYTNSGEKPKVITESQLIDVNTIGSGPYPENGVTVKYSTLELQIPDEPEEKLAWETDISEGDKVTIELTNPKYLSGAQAGFAAPESFTYTYIPTTVTVTTYDAYDRVLTRTTTTNSILAEVAPAAVQAGMGGSALPGGTASLDWTNDGGGSQPVFSTTQEVFEYKIKAPLSLSTLGEKLALKYNPPLGYEDILRKTTIVTEPLVKVYAGTMAYDVALKEGYSFAIPTGSVITEKTVETYDIGVSAQGTNLTKTFIDRYKNQGSSIVGQQGIASTFDATREDAGYFNAVALRVANSAANLKYIGREVKITEGRNIDLQRRPTAAERARKDFNPSDEAAANNGYALEQEMKTTASPGAGVDGFFDVVTMPYACDPKIIRIGSPPNQTYQQQLPVNPPDEMAKKFGAIYTRLKTGTRYGLSVQVAAKDLLVRPCAQVVLSINGNAAKYMANGITYTFDSNGIVASADLVLIGGVGGTSLATAFFPVADTITTLPTVPPVESTEPTEMLGSVASVTASPQTYLNAQFPTATAGDGVQDQTTLNFWVYDGAVWVNVGQDPGSTMVVTSTVPLTNQTLFLEGRLRTRLSAVSLPYGLNLLTTVPTYGVKVKLEGRRIRKVEAPAAALTLAAVAPAVSTGVAVNAPVAALALSGTAPAVAASSTSALLYPPAGAMTLAGVTPAVAAGPTDPDFASVGLLLHLDGSNGSTTFTDNSSNALSVSSSGGPTISTAQSVFGGSSAVFDQSASQYLTVSSSAVSLAGSSTPWTVEGRVRASSSPGSSGPRGLWYNGSLGSITNSWQFYLDYNLSGDFRFYVRAVDGSNTVPFFIRNASYTRTINTWYAVAYVYDGTNLSIYVDGSLDAQGVANTTSISSGNDFYVGMSRRTTATVSPANGNFFDGYIDEFRVTKGVARYTSGYTVANSPFPNS